MWRKSSFCNGASACVEVDYRTSTASSGNGECVEAAVCRCGDVDQVWVRDSKNPDGNVLRFTVESWWSFIAAIKTGQLAMYDGPIRLDQHDTGPWLMSDDAVPDVVLVFDEEEVVAFFAGVKAKEFDPDALATVAPAREEPRRPPASTEPREHVA